MSGYVIDKQNKRNVRSVLINPHFQWKLVVTLVTLLCLSLVLIGLGCWSFFFDFEQMGKAMELPPNHPFYTFINYQKKHFMVLFAVASLVSFLGVVVLGFILSHRMYGPVDRFCQHLAGQDLHHLTPISFRKEDYFPEIASHYNGFVARCNEDKKNAA